HPSDGLGRFADEFRLCVFGAVEKLGQRSLEGSPIGLAVRILEPKMHHMGKLVVKTVLSVQFLGLAQGECPHQEQCKNNPHNSYCSNDCFSFFEISKAE